MLEEFKINCTLPKINRNKLYGINTMNIIEIYEQRLLFIV